MGQMRVRRTGPWVKISCPFSWVQFNRCVGHGVGQAVGPHFGPYLKVHFCNEKHPKSEDFRCFLELLGRFELPTSSLPILPRLFFPTLLCFVLKPETLWFQTSFLVSDPLFDPLTVLNCTQENGHEILTHGPVRRTRI